MDESFYQERIQSLENEVRALNDIIVTKEAQVERISTDFNLSLADKESLSQQLLATQDKNASHEAKVLEFNKLMTRLADVEPQNEQIVALIEQFDLLISNSSQQPRACGNLVGDNIISRVSQAALKSCDIGRILDKVKTLEGSLKSKDVYCNQLLDLVESLKQKYESLKCDFSRELTSFNELLQSEQDRNGKLEKKCVVLADSLKEAEGTIEILTQKVTEADAKHEEFRIKSQEMINSANAQRDNYLEEVNSLNSLLRQSKEEMLEHYLKRVYPNITSINRMFQQNMSISEMFSQYFDFKKQNEDLLIEKKVLAERVASLDDEINVMKVELDKNDGVVKSLHHLESKVLHLENENKDLSVSKNFYHESAQSMYKAYKNFNDNFASLAEKIKLLVQHQSCQEVAEDAIDVADTSSSSRTESTSVLALKYIMELQNKFQELHKLCLDFEKRKIDFINEKQNVIETDKVIESLRSASSLLEMEKRQMKTNYDLLHGDYDRLVTVSECSKQRLAEENASLKQANVDLQSKLSVTNQEMLTIKATLEQQQQQLSLADEHKAKLEFELAAKNKDVEVIQSRLELQQQLVSQIEASKEHLRARNESLDKTIECLVKSQQLDEAKYLEATKKLAKAEVEIGGDKFQITSLKQIEQTLLKRLETMAKANIAGEQLTELLTSIKQNNENIEGTLGRQVVSAQQKQDSFTRKESMLEDRIRQLHEALQAEEAKVADMHKRLAERLDKDRFDNVDDQVKFELDTAKTAIEALNNELAECKTKYAQLSAENNKLKESEVTHRDELATITGQLAATKTELQCLQASMSAKLQAIESKHKEVVEHLQTEVARLQTLLTRKNEEHEANVKELGQLRSSIGELEANLQEAAASEKLFRVQVESYKAEYLELQTQMEQQLEAHLQRAEETARLTKTLEDYRNRSIEAEASWHKEREQLQTRLDRFQAEAEQLKAERDRLQDRVDTLNQLVVDRLANTDNKVFADLVDKQADDARVLANKCRLHEAKEARLLSEIDSLTTRISLLEKCLQSSSTAETQKVAAVAAANEPLEEGEKEMLGTLRQSLANKRSALEQMTKERDLYKLQVEQLNVKLGSNEKTSMLAMVTQTKIEINELKKELSEKNASMELSKHKLAAADKRHKELEDRSKVLQLNIVKLRKQFSEQKQSLEQTAKEDQTKLAANDAHVGSLTAEIGKLKELNEQLKAQMAAHEQNASNLAKRVKERMIVDKQRQTTLEREIRELNARIANLSAELEQCRANASQTMMKANMSSSSMPSTSSSVPSAGESSNSAGSSSGNNNNNKHLISSTHVTASSPRVPSTSSSSASSSPMLSSSTTFGMSSSKARNAQPSSSNEEDATVTLQSAQITSHSTSIDDNSFESFATAVAAANDNNNQALADSNVSGSSNDHKRSFAQTFESHLPPKLRRSVFGAAADTQTTTGGGGSEVMAAAASVAGGGDGGDEPEVINIDDSDESNSNNEALNVDTSRANEANDRDDDDDDDDGVVQPDDDADNQQQ